MFLNSGFAGAGPQLLRFLDFRKRGSQLLVGQFIGGEKLFGDVDILLRNRLGFISNLNAGLQLRDNVVFRGRRKRRDRKSRHHQHGAYDCDQFLHDFTPLK